eukprot:COSAG06_NODE_35950_length_453_cov_1.341808_1_plen_43_part_10
MNTENMRCFLFFAPRQLYSLRAQIELVRKDQTSFYTIPFCTKS